MGGYITINGHIWSFFLVILDSMIGLCTSCTGQGLDKLLSLRHICLFLNHLRFWNEHVPVHHLFWYIRVYFRAHVIGWDRLLRSWREMQMINSCVFGKIIFVDLAISCCGLRLSYAQCSHLSPCQHQADRLGGCPCCLRIHPCYRPVQKASVHLESYRKIRLRTVAALSSYSSPSLKPWTQCQSKCLPPLK